MGPGRLEPSLRLRQFWSFSSIFPVVIPLSDARPGVAHQSSSHKLLKCPFAAHDPFRDLLAAICSLVSNGYDRNIPKKEAISCNYCYRGYDASQAVTLSSRKCSITRGEKASSQP
jgi:hypothetical protein